MGDNRYLPTCGDKLCPCSDHEPCEYTGLKPALLPVSIHERNLRSLRCVLSSDTRVTLHHCHGGSMKDAGWHVGVSQKQNPFLQLPLALRYHVGDEGIDSGMGVETWEERYATQVVLLHELNGRMPYSIFTQAVLWELENRGATASRSTAIERLRSLDIPSTACEKPTATEN